MTQDGHIIETVHSAMEIAVMQRTIAEIDEILNAAFFDAGMARQKIHEVNRNYPDNLTAYKILYPPTGWEIPVSQANNVCLKQDLKWKAYYLDAKCRGKSIDAIAKELNR